MKKIIFSGFAIIYAFLFSGSNCAEKDKKTRDAGKKMQDFVMNISTEAKKSNADFIIIPQNGAELAFENCDPSKSLHQGYLNAIDGIGIEELFFDGDSVFDGYRLKMLKQITETKKVLVSEVIDNPENVEKAILKNSDEGFLCFPRSKENYHYSIIPEIHDENANDITFLKDAQNYLYLINSNNYGSKKEILEAINNTNYDLIIMDLYYLSFKYTRAEIESIKTKKNGGKRLIIAYMNIGAAENWREYWQPEWKLGKPKWLKKSYKGYENETIVEYWDSQWQKIIFGNSESYLQKILDAGFDGVYLDNVEAFYTLYN